MFFNPAHKFNIASIDLDDLNMFHYYCCYSRYIVICYVQTDNHGHIITVCLVYVLVESMSYIITTNLLCNYSTEPQHPTPPDETSQENVR